MDSPAPQLWKLQIKLKLVLKVGDKVKINFKSWMSRPPTLKVGNKVTISLESWMQLCKLISTLFATFKVYCTFGTIQTGDFKSWFKSVLSTFKVDFNFSCCFLSWLRLYFQLCNFDILTYFSTCGVKKKCDFYIFFNF